MHYFYTIPFILVSLWGDLGLTTPAHAFQPQQQPAGRLFRRPSSSRSILFATALERASALYPNPPPRTEYDQIIQDMFPGALSNKDLVTRVVSSLVSKGFTTQNTLLGTSLCSDETAHQLVSDFTQVYGGSFNLGGLAGFPFAGNIGFANMAQHVPDEDGAALIVYGPHVGVSQTTGEVGVVERAGVAQLETCCTSAIVAYETLQRQGTDAAMPMTDLQQAAVQHQIAPYMESLSESDDPSLELPYVLFYSQNSLWDEIVSSRGINASRGLALLGGVQINTSPNSLDYFVPLRFDFFNREGQRVEDLLDKLRSTGGDDSSSPWDSETMWG